MTFNESPKDDESQSSHRTYSTTSADTDRYDRDPSRSDPPVPSIWSKLGFGLGHIFNDLCASIWFSYLMLFMKNVLTVPGGGAAGLLMFGQIVDATATPLVGLLSDEFGTKQTWHIFGSILVFLSFPLIYAVCPMCGIWPSWWRYFYLTITIMVFQIGWPIVQVTHLAVIPEISASQKDRNILSSIRYSGQVISSIIAFGVTWAILGSQNDMSKVNPSDVVHFQYVVGILTVIGTCTTVIYQLSLTFGIYKQRRIYNLLNSRHTANGGYQIIGGTDGYDSDSNITQPLLSARRHNNYFRSPALYSISLLYICGRIFTTTSLIYIPLWLDDQVKAKSQLATVPLVSYLASFLTSLPIDILVRKLGPKTIYMSGVVIGIIGSILVETSALNVSDACMYAVAVLLGAGSSITVISSLCLIADMIGENTEQSGRIYSYVTTTDKFVTGVVVLALEMGMSNNDHNYYKYCLSRVCGGSVIIAAVYLVLFSLFTCIRNKMNQN